MKMNEVNRRTHTQTQKKNADGIKNNTTINYTQQNIGKARAKLITTTTTTKTQSKVVNSRSNRIDLMRTK